MIQFNRRPHPVLATRSVFPLQEERQPRYAEPLPARATLGHVTLINDNEAFFQGLNSSIEMYFEDEEEYEQRTRTANDLCQELLEILTELDAEVPLSWRLGFALGRIAGLLNPDLAETNPRMSCLEALSHKCEVMYPGPEQWSMYTRAIHKAACIDTVPIEGLPALQSVTLPSRVQQDQ